MESCWQQKRWYQQQSSVPLLKTIRLHCLKRRDTYRHLGQHFSLIPWLLFPQNVLWVFNCLIYIIIQPFLNKHYFSIYSHSLYLILIYFVLLRAIIRCDIFFRTIFCFQMLDFETSKSNSEVSKSNSWKLLISRKLRYFRGSSFSQCFTNNSSPLLVTN